MLCRRLLANFEPILDRLVRNSTLQASCSVTCSEGSASLTSLTASGEPTCGPFGMAGCRFMASKSSAQEVVRLNDASKGFKDGGFDVSHFPLERIRNFSIIAHIDHGKSTLADRLMEVTGAIPAGGKGQYLDKLQVERERGITVKAQTASLVYNHRGEDYLLNLIDTPGHVDFSYEVSRSLAAVSGALLLVDAAQGIQAQTVANFYLAFEQNLAIVPVLNKCDMASADPDQVAEQMQQVFDIEPERCLRVSAKTGVGLEQVMPAVIEGVPPPTGNERGPLRMLLFDAVHDEYRGVICLLKVVDGEAHKGDRITAASNGEHYDILEVGYIITGMKTTKNALIGDTWHLYRQPVEPLPGFKLPQSMVFAGVFPEGAAEFEQLSAAMERLTLNDSSVTVFRENSAALGAGFRCGFLGLLHMEVFHQRLENEHGARIISTPPTVPYTIQYPDGTQQHIQNASEFPLGRKIAAIWEPTVNATIITPNEFVGGLMNLCQERRGDLTEHNVLGPGKTMLRYVLPLAELGSGFYDTLKSISSGYANFDYEEGETRTADLVRLDLLINGVAVDALARVVHRDKAQRSGRILCATMKDLMERQMYEVVIQASANNKIVARETLRAYRKNVLAKCYGGDVSRKRKLLDKQKEGKKRMAKLQGGVEVPTSVFHTLIKQSC